MSRDDAHLPKDWPKRVKASILTAISLAHLAICRARGQAVNSRTERVRLAADNNGLTNDVATRREVERIKDARMLAIPAAKRPHYPPTERLAILELRAACGWSAAETARRFLVSPATISEWMSRLEEQGKEALVQMPAPVNKYPELVTYIVQKCKALNPILGKTKIARELARAGLHLGRSTVGRFLKKSPGEAPAGEDAQAAKATEEKLVSERTVTAKRPNHVMHVDLTVVPIVQFWVPWLPFCLPQVWPFCWWVLAATDHFSRRVMKLAVFRKEPTAKQVTDALDRAIKAAGKKPKHIIFDKGPQFWCAEMKAWCRSKRPRIKPRYGAVGRHGSIAIVERFIRAFKTECTRRLTVMPMRIGQMIAELQLYADWFNEERGHTALGGKTPNEVYFKRKPANEKPRFEPRAKWPRKSKCAAPQATVRGPCGVKLELVTTFVANRKHLPIIRLKVPA